MDIYNHNPLTVQRAKDIFPKLDVSGFQVTSPLDVGYNCFAWAAGDPENVWQPDPNAKYYVWFTDSRAETLENFIANYAAVGFTEKTDGSLEEGFEKIALYVDKNGIPQHAARQKGNGAWTSKLGILEDIEHTSLECLECETYGSVQVILRRPTNGSKKA